MFGGSRKDKGFSSKNKIQQHHGDGTETIIVMGRPFRVLQKLSDVPAPYMAGAGRRKLKHTESETPSYVFLVENSSRLPEFPRHLALKRSFFPVDQVQEAHKEIEIMSRIKDKNIVRVYHSEISRSEGKLGVSIAMEYCGNNLYRRIRSGSAGGAGTRLSESEITHILLAMTSALGYLHSQQPPIAHRDIRPENVLIDNTHTGATAYKLCNFGSATTDAYQCETREEASMAINDIEFHTNPAFRSPEMADPWSKKRICERSDMWSLGVLLYYMMYLKLPFEPTNMALSANPKVRFPASDVGRYSGSLRLIVEHLLEPNPEDRWDVFALTNFLRFDEDVSRHLGTFCFTRTEYPEGWEQQDVKTLNRDPPPKPPPVTYNGEAGHIHVDQDRAAGEARRAEVAAGNGGNNGPSNRSSPPPARTGAAAAAAAGGGGGGANMTDDAVREAMMVLGGGDDDDPEMAQYREMIIREQEEALARFKKPGGSGGGSGGDAGAAPSASAGSNAGSAPAQPPAEPPKKKDLFDDLFAGPAEPPAPPQPQPMPAQAQAYAQPPQAASTSSSPMPQQQQQKDAFSADDLFSAPPPQPQQQQMPMQGYGMQPQQQQAYGGGWGSGMPTGAMAPPQQQQPWGTGYPQQQQQQQQQQPQQYGGGYNTNSNYGGGYGGQPQMPQQQPPQQQQASFNFMAPPPGQQPSQPQQQQQPSAAPPATTVSSKKDPFADLFS